MPPEQQLAFRQRFLALMAGLQSTRTDPKLRALVGTAGNSIAQKVGATSWSDLKERADGPTYDKVLVALRENASKMAKRNEGRGVRAFEILAVSMISRRQTDEDLKAGIATLDRYVDDCVSVAKTIAAGRSPTTV